LSGISARLDRPAISTELVEIAGRFSSASFPAPRSPLDPAVLYALFFVVGSSRRRRAPLLSRCRPDAVPSIEEWAAMMADRIARTETAPSGPRTIRELLAETRGRHGPRPALRDRVAGEWRFLSHAELADAAADFGAGLLRLGLQPGDKIAVVAANGIEWCVAWLGAALVGGVSVPVSGELAANEINSIAKQSESRFAVVGAAFAAKLDARPREKVIVVEHGAKHGEDPAAIVARFGAKGLPFSAVSTGIGDDERASFAASSPHPSDLVAIIYTSGTTGDPKGVMLSQRNVVSNAIASMRVVGAGPSDRVLLVLPMHHALPFTAGLLTPLVAGAEVVFESDLRRIRDRMAEVQPTVFLGVPALYAQLYRAVANRMEAEGRLDTFRKAERISLDIKRRTGVNVGGLLFRQLHEKFGGKMRLMVGGGAAMPADLMRKYYTLGLAIMQGWGLTEASPSVAGQVLRPARFLFTDYFERTAGTVGPALPDVDVAAIDVPEKNIYVQLSGEGEVLVRGPNVMHGYFKNEAATREVMLGDWLRTGDLGRIDRDGNIFLTGRAKSVIVLDSGEKVYPDEIEERFESQPLTRDVCILGRRPNRLLGDRKTQVVAVVYPDSLVLRERARESRERLTPDLVRRWVQQEVDVVQTNLAPFKRISEIILTDAPLPRTDLKKVRRGQIKDHYSFDLDKLLESDGHIEI
jgi:long-chain acyl-CoA synthetase